MKKLLASMLICFGMFSFVQAQLKGTIYKITIETTQAEFDKTCKENPGITEIRYTYNKPISLDNLNSIAKLTNLKELYIKDVLLNTPLDFSLLKNKKSLEIILLKNVLITKTEELGQCPSLKNLTLNDCEISSLTFLSGTPNVKRLVLGGTTLDKVSDFTPINKQQNLEWLEISNSSKPNNDNLKALSGMQNLKRLALFKLDQITNINFLKNCINIEKLNIVKCNNFSNISIISTFTKLKQLDISETNVSSIKGIGSSSQTLERLYMEKCPIANISELKNLHRLLILNMNYTKITSLADLEGLKNLISLNIKGTDISDISPLTKCPAFRGGDFGEKVTDISPLQKCAGLVSVSFPKKNQAILQNQVSELRKTKPSLKSRFY